jgi:hypothetical protein
LVAYACAVHLAGSVDADLIAGLVVLQVAGDVGELEIGLYYEIGRDFETDCHVDIGHQERDAIDEDVANSGLRDASGAAGHRFVQRTDLTLLDASDMDRARTAGRILGNLLGCSSTIVVDNAAVPCSHIVHRADVTLGLFLRIYLHGIVPIVTSLGVPVVGANCLVADPADIGNHDRPGSPELAGIPRTTGADFQDHHAPPQFEHFARTHTLHCDRVHT